MRRFSEIFFVLPDRMAFCTFRFAFLGLSGFDGPASAILAVKAGTKNTIFLEIDNYPLTLNDDETTAHNRPQPSLL
jgi:hypothetical protein